MPTFSLKVSKPRAAQPRALCRHRRRIARRRASRCIAPAPPRSRPSSRQTGTPDSLADAGRSSAILTATPRLRENSRARPARGPRGLRRAARPPAAGATARPAPRRSAPGASRRAAPAAPPRRAPRRRRRASRSSASWRRSSRPRAVTYGSRNRSANGTTSNASMRAPAHVTRAAGPRTAAAENSASSAPQRASAPFSEGPSVRVATVRTSGGTSGAASRASSSSGRAVDRRDRRPRSRTAASR